MTGKVNINGMRYIGTKSFKSDQDYVNMTSEVENKGVSWIGTGQKNMMAMK